MDLQTIKPGTIGTLRMKVLIAGRYKRGSLEDMFAEIIRRGGTVSYWKQKGFFETVYHEVEIAGTVELIRTTVTVMNRLGFEI